VSSQAYSNLAGNTTIKLTIGDQIPKSLDISGAKNIEGNAQTQIAATDQLSCKTDTGDEVSGVVYEADGLPNGLEIDKETGIISGAPNDEGFGLYTITTTADGLTGSVSRAFKIDSQIVESFTINVPTEPITGNALYELTTDELSCSVNGTVVESGVSYSASSLPKGLSIDKDTGIISGTPTGPTANGTTATITANYTEGGKNLVATAGMVFNISNTLVISSIKLASDPALRDACNLRIDADGVLNQIQN
jgi:hypothetical protein